MYLSSIEFMNNSLFEGVPGTKPSVTSDKLLDSPSKLPCNSLGNKLRI